MIPLDFTIRQAVPGDALMLAELGALTFSQAFGEANTPENLAAYLASSFSPEIQADEISRPGSLYFVAEAEGQPVGYARIQVGSRETCITGTCPVELVRIYMRQEWSGRGGGARLIQACIDAAHSRGGDVLWLGVWEKNPRAIAFYQRAGFIMVGTHTFQLGSETQLDYIMQLKLE